MEILVVRVKKGKVKTYDIDVDKALAKAGTIAIVFMGGLHHGVAYAVTEGGITAGLQPLIDLLKDLAEPVAYGFMVKGFMKVMSGEEHEGIKTIKGAVGGYIGIQWIPYIFKIIKNIKF